MNRKMLVLDIDGTLTNSEKEVTVATLEKITACQRRGHVVVVASGRPTPGIDKIAEIICLAEYDGYVLSFNGARITRVQTGDIVYQKNLEQSLIPKLYSYSIANDLGMMTYDDNVIITGTRIDQYMELEARINGISIKQVDGFPDYVNFPVCKCLLTKEPESAKFHEEKLQLEFQDCASIYRSEPFFIEIMAKGIDKAAALEQLRRQLKIEREDIVACGDGYNDISMLQYAGIGVAMDNARQEVKAAADYITASNDADGIAEVVDRFFLSRSL